MKQLFYSMGMQRKIMGREEDRLSDLHESVLLHILSLLEDSKEVVRTSVLSKQWKFLWMSVPLSLVFDLCACSEKDILDFLASINRELYYWRSCKKIQKFTVYGLQYMKRYVKDVDIWVHFATKVANVEDFTLEIDYNCDPEEQYEFPQYAFKNTLLRRLGLSHCQLNPSGSVNWRNLVSLSIACVKLTDNIMEKVLSGCPNLECLVLDEVSGIHHLEISSKKLRELIITDVYLTEAIEILAPYIQKLQLFGFSFGIHFAERTVPSLVNAVLHLDTGFSDDENKYENELSGLKKLLESVVYVQNLELGRWCIECLSELELQGWQSPPSSLKVLKLNTALIQSDFPGLCSFLRSSSGLETLVIDWSNYQRMNTNMDEQCRRFEPHNYNYSLLHLKTIEIINIHGPLSGNDFIWSLVKYFLKSATVLEKLIIAARFKWSDVSQDYVKMEQELLSFPRSSPHASVVFSYH